MMGLSELISRRKPGKSDHAGEAGGTAPREPRVSPAEVLGAAVRAGRRDWRRILVVAITVSMVSSAVEIVIDHFVDPSDGVLSAAASLCATGVSLLGTVLLAGFICRLISAAERGGQPLSLPRLARTLPWGRLVAADVLVALITVAGLVLLVIPGLVALTLLAVVGPVIEIEHQKVFAALRRSAQLTRRHPWAVVLLATIPLAVASELEAIAPDPHHADEIVQFLIVRGLAEGIVEAAIAVVLVELCFRLIDSRAAASAAAKAVPPPRDGGTSGLSPVICGNRHATT
jgi:hypothetical protein